MPEISPELKNILTRRQVHLERLKTHEQAEYLPFLEQMRDRLRRFFDNDISDLSRARLQKRLDNLNRAIAEIQDGYKEVWLKQISDISQQESQFAANSLGVVIDTDFSLPTPTQLDAAVFSSPLRVVGPNGGELLAGFFKNVTDADRLRVENAIKLGFANGDTNAQIARSIVGTQANKFNDGILNTTRRSANMIVRTGVQHASQAAREATYSANKKIVKMMEWSSTLDSRTTEQCQALDGQRFPFGKGPRPPIHVGCRSTMIPVLDSRFDFLREGATRSARGQDGVEQVSARQTYYSWLKSQDMEFQETAIGEKWARLLNNGGLSSGRFAELRLDKNFSPLTLKEVAELEPIALRKAGMMLNDSGNVVFRR